MLLAKLKRIYFRASHGGCNIILRSAIVFETPTAWSHSLTESADTRSLEVVPHRLSVWMQAKDEAQRICFSPHVEKLTVSYVGQVGSPATLSMTKGISAPIDCAKHLSKLLVDRSTLALVDGSPWDMHRPLSQDCSIDFLHMKDAHHSPEPTNTAFWKSANFLLAGALESAFRPVHQVRLVHLHQLCPERGAFACDFRFKLLPTSSSSETNPWIPSQHELRALSSHAQRMAVSAMIFESVDVTFEGETFNTLFSDDVVRKRQISSELNISDNPNMGSDVIQQNDHTCSIYRMGNFVEVASGPLISNTRLIGRFAVTLLQPLGWLRTASGMDRSVIVYRAQGLALPVSFITHHTTFDILMRRATQPIAELSPAPDYVVPF